MTINQFFSEVFCIYLEKRAQDWKLPDTGEIIPGCLPLVQKEFKTHHITATMTPGVDGELLEDFSVQSADGMSVSKGDLGCTISHLKILREAISKKLDSYFVFESDVVLHPNFTTLFSWFIEQVPDDWDMIYLGGNHDGGFKYLNPSLTNYDHLLLDASHIDFIGKNNIVRLFHSYTTHAIGVRQSVYKKLLDVWSRTEKVDVAVADLHSKINCYGFRPHLAWQRTGYSDILNRLTHYCHLKTGSYQFDQQSEKWLQKTT